jgi:hypothetical protein
VINFQKFFSEILYIIIFVKLIIIYPVIAQTVTITNINIIPSNPTQADSIELSVNSRFPCADIVLRDSSINISDTTITILIIFEGPGMLPLVTTHTTNFRLDPLDPGFYRITCNVFWYYTSSFTYDYYDTSFVVNPYLSIPRPLMKTKPDEFILNQNYPNPFNPTTTIKYNLPQSSAVVIQIFNSLGEKIKTLYSGPQTSGTHEIVFDGSSLPSGIYFYQITTKDFSQTKKCLLLK